ncbi:hypothetical protein HanRHA438_Chr16g0784171 [Helianthus annuus]|nr:hypothetical protein HanRHA438_Chr16g0784171 [Helianthus annuus]
MCRHYQVIKQTVLYFQLADLQTTSSVADIKTDEISLQTIYVCKNKQHLNGYQSTV